MTSLCRHLSAKEIVNWVTTVDGCVHTADATVSSASASAVCIGHKTLKTKPLLALLFTSSQATKSQYQIIALNYAMVIGHLFHTVSSSGIKFHVYVYFIIYHFSVFCSSL